MKEQKRTIELSESEFETLMNSRIPDKSNHVLIELKHKVENERSDAGIYKFVSTTVAQKNYMNMYGTIAKVPNKLHYDSSIKKHYNAMSWITDVEVKEGDVVWWVAHVGNTVDRYKYCGREFMLVHYELLILAKRGDELIPVNGNMLLEDVNYKDGFGEYKVEKKEKFKFVVRYLGKPNKGYFNKKHSDEIDVSVGDTVYASFGGGTEPPYLEGDLFRSLDKQYRYCKRIDLLYVFK